VELSTGDTSLDLSAADIRRLLQMLFEQVEIEEATGDQ
jgi:hypothetical protein